MISNKDGILSLVSLETQSETFQSN